MGIEKYVHFVIHRKEYISGRNFNRFLCGVANRKLQVFKGSLIFVKGS